MQNGQSVYFDLIGNDVFKTGLITLSYTGNLENPYPEIMMPRFCLPSKRDASSKVRLICLADAAEFAGGAAVYAGVETSPGTWSCSLLAAKSKLMKETIPRNELSAILLCAELAFMVKSSLGSKVGEVIYLTDSTVALSWCSSETIKLRLFVFHRFLILFRNRMVYVLPVQSRKGFVAYRQF